MANGVGEALEKFFSMLQVSPGTINLNKLHQMCLMPLLNDILGGKLYEYATEDLRFWNNFLSACFPELCFDTDSC